MTDFRIGGWPSLGRRCRVLAVAAGLVAAALPAGAQGTCQANNENSCTINGNATRSITVGISVAARLSTTLSTVVLPAPSVSSFDAGFGTAVSVPFSVRSNTSWAVTIRATSALWAATPVSARQNKPASDLQWGLAPGGPFVDMTTTAVALASGAATGTGSISLYLRAKFAWTLDRAGAYTIPVQLVITAP